MLFSPAAQHWIQAHPEDFLTYVWLDQANIRATGAKAYLEQLAGMGYTLDTFVNSLTPHEVDVQQVEARALPTPPTAAHIVDRLFNSPLLITSTTPASVIKEATTGPAATLRYHAAPQAMETFPAKEEEENVVKSYTHTIAKAPPLPKKMLPPLPKTDIVIRSRPRDIQIKATPVVCPYFPTSRRGNVKHLVVNKPIGLRPPRANRIPPPLYTATQRLQQREAATQRLQEQEVMSPLALGPTALEAMYKEMDRIYHVLNQMTVNA